jgi:beta-fructofuranosidase
LSYNKQEFISANKARLKEISLTLFLFVLIFPIISKGGNAMERKKLESDPHRPIYHFLPPANWMNDPNGLIQWEDGTYHLFYQYNPDFPQPANIRWGHAVSKDLLHWEDYPIALAPTPGGPDKDGCWTGCAVNDNGTPTLIYTGVFPECVCIATGDKKLLTFQKYENNPVIAKPPEGMEVTGFRDPYVWREPDGWYLVLGSGIKGKGGLALLYHSKNLRNWEYLHPLCEGKEEETGFMWECPNFFPIGDDKYVLITSPIPLGYPIYLMGRYKEHRLSVERIGKVDGCEHSFYAPQIFRDRKGRLIMFGWLRELRSAEAQKEAGWSGVMSLPRQISLKDGEFSVDVIPEAEKLRGKMLNSLSNIELKGDSFLPLENVKGDALEIIARFRPMEGKSFGVVVRRSENGEEETLIGYDAEKKAIFVDASRSSLDDSVARHICYANLELKDNALILHIYLDRSVIEAFVNNKIALSTRVYPTRRDSVGVGLFSKGGKTELEKFEAYELGSIWK